MTTPQPPSELDRELDEILVGFAKRIESMPRGKTYGWEDEKRAIQKHTEAAVLEVKETYTWDSWSVGWRDDDKHYRQLVLIQDGKVITNEIVADGEFCACKPYRHGWPTVEACIETWAKTKVAALKSPKQERESL